MFEASENRPLVRTSDGISPGHNRDCTPTKSEMIIPNEADFMEHLRLIIEQWKHATGKQPNFLSSLNEFREKLLGINGCTIQEMLNLHQFFKTLLDFRNNDPVLLHCLKTVTYEIQRKQFQQQQQQKEMAFCSYTNIDRLAKALASLQTRNEHQVPPQVIHQQSNAPIKENKINGSIYGSSSITEVAKALANMQGNDSLSSHTDASFIPMPPGWNARGERTAVSPMQPPGWNSADVASMAHNLSTMRSPMSTPLYHSDPVPKPVSPLHQQMMPMPIGSPLGGQVIGSPPQSSILGTSPITHGGVIRSPIRNRTPVEVEQQQQQQLPIGAKWEAQQQTPQPHNPAMYTLQSKSPEPLPNVPVDAFPSPSEIGGDEFLEEEKPILRNTAWKVVGCTAKPPKAPETMAAILKKSLSTEPRQPSSNYSYVGQQYVASTPSTKVSKSEAFHSKSKSADSSGSNSVDIWESSEEESESNLDPLIDPKNPLQATSVWVGNLTNNIEKEMLYPHFMKIGYISNIVMVHENHCAFVNFENPRAAGRAMRDLQGLVVEGVKLLLRYPNRFLGGDHSVKLRDTTPQLPGRPKRGGQPAAASPKRPNNKKHSK